MRKNLDSLVKYVYKRYPYPKRWWSKVHFQKRCTEIYISEQAILRCMDTPNQDIRDTIYEYLIEIEFCSRDAENPIVKQKFSWMVSTLTTLWNYLS